MSKSRKALIYLLILLAVVAMAIVYWFTQRSDRVQANGQWALSPGIQAVSQESNLWKIRALPVEPSRLKKPRAVWSRCLTAAMSMMEITEF